MSAEFDCHINVECTVSFGTTKYITKYVHKGCNHATLEINQRDEIKRFLDSHYVSASESAWRIFHFIVHHQEPNVVQLNVHLPGHHMVSFDPDEDPVEVLQRAANERTTLTGFFQANANPELSESASQLTYQEFPQSFVWKEDRKCWALRQRGWVLGRMVFTAPNSGERFYLRTLLTVVKGAKSFEDLRFYNGRVLPTF